MLILISDYCSIVRCDIFQRREGQSFTIPYHFALQYIPVSQKPQVSFTLHYLVQMMVLNGLNLYIKCSVHSMHNNSFKSKE